MNGKQFPKPALARRIVEATGGAVTLDGFFAGDGGPTGKIVSLDEARRQSPDIEPRRLTIAMAIAINHLLPAEADDPPSRAVELAAEATINTFAALGPVTTRQGPARLTQALRPVLEVMLREWSGSTPPAGALDRGAGRATDLYFQSWRPEGKS